MTLITTADYPALFLHDTPFIDTRAPIEFAKGALPTSTNLPLMTDDERAQVGTCYKRYGQQAAIALGHQLVSGQNKNDRIQAWLDFAQKHPNGCLYCWRGGLRSQTVQQWLHEVGCDYPRIDGGYKALRTFLIEQQENILNNSKLIILSGRTGCAKTELLKQIPNSLDLEAIANHRGSTFGKHPEGQPTQLNFENRLAIHLFRIHHTYPHTPIIIEDESNLIGRCALPEIWRQKMMTAPRILIEAPLNDRIEHSYHNYILGKLGEWQQTLSNDEDAFNAFARDLQQSLSNIQKRLGGVRYQQLAGMMDAALSAHRHGNPNQHRIWIERLLTEYYDPMYDYQIEKKSHLIIHRGGATDTLHFLLTKQ